MQKAAADVLAGTPSGFEFKLLLIQAAVARLAQLQGISSQPSAAGRKGTRQAGGSSAAVTLDQPQLLSALRVTCVGMSEEQGVQVEALLGADAVMELLYDEDVKSVGVHPAAAAM